ncbi:tyrosine protein phosphatase [Ornithinibacillus sp. BX22]|uniref:Tyrosine-protein phosphatase n=1 Tax=Ornithinibacillus hominis TaxID=2763055 RepID=A0A923L3B7_9BACI|nr:CpsB/CapC family capsule biosynthesis tyrosine phosphatase [Ornithinibacillus hominis]MBC5635714.1 tyrosine protein phosphatase [Ornithinibacillus hominis]
MIDIHSHILPGVDDGAKTIDDSLVMAQEAVQQGIHTIIATPHHQNGKYINVKEDIEIHVEKLNKALREKNIPLTVLTGQETRIHGDLIQELEASNIATLNNTRYLFIEFPFGYIPQYAEQMVFDIQVAGYKPIIVHPERNRQIAENPSTLYNFVRKGALTQVTAASLAGKFGKTVQKLSHQLIDYNLAHFIASDAHNTTSRGFVMREAYRILKNKHGNDTYYMFMENAQLVIDGLHVHQDEPARIRKNRKVFGLF